MKRLISIFVILLHACFGSFAQNRDSVLMKIDLQAVRMNNFQCRFIQKKSVSILDGESVSTGSLYFSKPDKMCCEYENPYFYRFVINGERAMFKNDKSVKVIDAGSNNKFSLIYRMFLGESGSGIIDEKWFDRFYTISEQDIVVTLIPKAKDFKRMFSKTVIRYDKTDYSVNEIIIFDLSGDRTDIILKEKVFDTVIDESVFKIE